MASSDALAVSQSQISLRQAYNACREAGLPQETLAAFGQALCSKPSLQWTVGLRHFARLCFLLTELACLSNPTTVPALVALTPLLHTQPSEGAAQWIVQCLHIFAEFAPDTAATIRHVLREAVQESFPEESR